MVKFRYDKSQEGESPPAEFCKENCKSGGIESLADYDKRNLLLLKRGTKHGHEMYWFKRSLIRNAMCDECSISNDYFIQQKLQQAKENLLGEIK